MSDKLKKIYLQKKDIPIILALNGRHYMLLEEPSGYLGLFIIQDCSINADRGNYPLAKIKEEKQD